MQLLIPDKDTTYWCSVYRLPDEVISKEKHIIKVCLLSYQNIVVIISILCSTTFHAVWSSYPIIIYQICASYCGISLLKSGSYSCWSQQWVWQCQHWYWYLPRWRNCGNNGCLGCWRRSKTEVKCTQPDHWCCILNLLLQDFVYPKDIAYPIGGHGNPQYVILEMHYDNPNQDSGENIALYMILESSM